MLIYSFDIKNFKMHYLEKITLQNYRGDIIECLRLVIVLKTHETIVYDICNINDIDVVFSDLNNLFNDINNSNIVNLEDKGNELIINNLNFYSFYNLKIALESDISKIVLKHTCNKYLDIYLDFAENFKKIMINVEFINADMSKDVLFRYSYLVNEELEFISYNNIPPNPSQNFVKVLDTLKSEYHLLKSLLRSYLK
ncbi:hypothetical protein [Brachyspira alvinipulli]|uniref:hypothetical protein n=1 Tax=Brachyspira alvinipulli TaxID=84379 RepID=UPI00047F4980|nr:hypothetical protein [Brachyspira alvinipulli]